MRRLLPWLLRWGAAARVLSPPDAVERLRDEAEALAGRYGEG
jgi:predicted DNA-binding transcriptional regulator YafY